MLYRRVSCGGTPGLPSDPRHGKVRGQGLDHRQHLCHGGAHDRLAGDADWRRVRSFEGGRRHAHEVRSHRGQMVEHEPLRDFFFLAGLPCDVARLLLQLWPGDEDHSTFGGGGVSIKRFPPPHQT